MTILESLRERVQYEGLPILGWVTWYAISETGGVDHQQFTELLEANGITDSAPPVPRPSDIFKRACTNAQRTRIATSDPERFSNILVRRVGHDADNIWRTVVEEIVDTQGHTLSYTEQFRLHYERHTGHIDVEPVLPLDGGPSAACEQVVQDIRDYYNAWARRLTAYTVREWVRAQLRALSATVLRDGVYFVRADLGERVHALETVVNALPGSLFHTLPLVDDTQQRAMLKRAFEDESIYEVNRLLAEVQDIQISGRRPTSHRAAEFMSEARRVRERIAEYAEMLDQSFDDVAARLEVLQASWETMLELVSDDS